MSLHDLRRSYEYGSLNRSDLLADPIEQFQLWFSQVQSLIAPEWFEPNAMTLSTSINGSDERSARIVVASRIVLLKYIDADGFVFFTNYLSNKGEQLSKSDYASLNFHWAICDRQVRIEGTVARTDSSTSDEYFHARPILSQLGAIVSPQSKVIPDDLDLEVSLRKLKEEYAQKPIPRPEYWGGYRLRPEQIEFWQGRPSRLHDRFRYRRMADNQWSIERLAP